MSEHSTFKRALVILRQALVILVLTIVPSEIALRIFDHFHKLPIFHSDSYNRWRPKPFAADYGRQLNSKGFNDDEFQVRKDEGTFRIVGLGDSFAFGVVPYADNYLTLLEQGLNRQGRKIELINMGVPGTSPYDYRSVLTNEGLELKPDRKIRA